MIGLLTSALLVALQPVPPDEQIPGQLIFARLDLGGWHIEATTSVADTTPPTVSQIWCEASRPGIAVVLDRTGRTRVTIARNADTDGGDEANTSFAPLNITGIRVGAADYRTRAVDTQHGPHRFTDVAYPEHEILLSSFGGYVAVRRRSGDPWLPLDAHLAELMAARNLRVTYQPDNRETGTRATYVIPLNGLSAALARCQAEITSPFAYRLRGD
jgi:hypothetical protein